MRNKEFNGMTALCMGLSVACAILLFMIKPLAALAAAPFLILVNGIFWWFTRRRYLAIRALSEYLEGVYSGRPVMDIRDNREGELSILKNDLYKVTLTLWEQSELLKKDKEYLADTLSNISHQLKTPLTSMIMMTDLLSSPSLPLDKRDEFLNNILRQLERIEWLVSSLLKLSKIDAQAVQFKKENVSVKEMLETALEPMRIPMELKELNLEVSCGEAAVVQADGNWTTEAFLNVIKNCVEHTPPGGTVKISCEDTALYTKVDIADNGEGIAAEDMPHIFERFYKGKNACADSVGIGLAMAKTILQSQSADIEAFSATEAASVPGETVSLSTGAGTLFTIKFYKQIL